MPAATCPYPPIILHSISQLSSNDASPNRTKWDAWESSIGQPGTESNCGRKPCCRCGSRRSGSGVKIPTRMRATKEGETPRYARDRAGKDEAVDVAAGGTGTGSEEGKLAWLFSAEAVTGLFCHFSFDIFRQKVVSFK